MLDQEQCKILHIRNVFDGGLIQKGNDEYETVWQIPSTTHIDGTLLWQFVPYSDPNDDSYVIFNKQNKKAMYFHGEYFDTYSVYTSDKSFCSLNRKFKIVEDKSGTGCNIVTANNEMYLGIPLCGMYDGKTLIQKLSNGADCQTFAIEEMSRVKIFYKLF